jgi:hypothetical protein
MDGDNKSNGNPIEYTLETTEEEMRAKVAASEAEERYEVLNDALAVELWVVTEALAALDKDKPMGPAGHLWLVKDALVRLLAYVGKQRVTAYIDAEAARLLANQKDMASMAGSNWSYQIFKTGEPDEWDPDVDEEDRYQATPTDHPGTATATVTGPFTVIELPQLDPEAIEKARETIARYQGPKDASWQNPKSPSHPFRYNPETDGGASSQLQDATLDGEVTVSSGGVVDKTDEAEEYRLSHCPFCGRSMLPGETRCPTCLRDRSVGDFVSPAGSGS